MLNMKFKTDDYISLEVGLEHQSGDPVVVGTLVGVCITGSGSASPINNNLNDPNYNGLKWQGVGNKPGWASVALAGGAEVTLPNGLTPNIGDTLYITSGGTLTATAAGNQRFGKVTHKGFDASHVIVKIVQ